MPDKWTGTYFFLDDFEMGPLQRTSFGADDADNDNDVDDESWTGTSVDFFKRFSES